MLILGRSVGDVTYLQVGDVEIQVKIHSARRGYVRLSFVAPKAVKIQRDNARRTERKERLSHDR
jgi:carbon storage regulator CsrA